MENKKIKGATPKVYDNITFRSTLECSCYKKLKDSGLDFSYESERALLWEGIKLQNVLVYAPNNLGNGKYSRNIELQTRSLLGITYTPDFIVTKDNYKIYIEVKGKPNDVYSYKKKMFLKVLEKRKDAFKYIFIEPHSVRQMLQAIEHIKNNL